MTNSIAAKQNHHRAAPSNTGTAHAPKAMSLSEKHAPSAPAKTHSNPQSHSTKNPTPAQSHPTRNGNAEKPHDHGTASAKPEAVQAKNVAPLPSQGPGRSDRDRLSRVKDSMTKHDMAPPLRSPTSQIATGRRGLKTR